MGKGLAPENSQFLAHQVKVAASTMKDRTSGAHVSARLINLIEDTAVAHARVFDGGFTAASARSRSFSK